MDACCCKRFSSPFFSVNNADDADDFAGCVVVNPFDRFNRRTACGCDIFHDYNAASSAQGGAFDARRIVRFSPASAFGLLANHEAQTWVICPGGGHCDGRQRDGSELKASNEISPKGIHTHVEQFAEQVCGFGVHHHWFCVKKPPRSATTRQREGVVITTINEGEVADKVNQSGPTGVRSK
jgi:hypothetical protein